MNFKSSKLRDIWNNNYPSKERREELSIEILAVEKIFMLVIESRRFLSLGRFLRERFIPNKCQDQFTDFYVVGRLLVLFILLLFLNKIGLGGIIPALVIYEIWGALNYPLGVVFIDRYDKEWAPKSYNRSLILLFVNFLEITIGFSYLYLHFSLVGYSNSGETITRPLEAIYFSIVTITTLGYGELSPIHYWGRVLSSVETIMGIILIVGIVGIFFVELGKQKKF